MRRARVSLAALFLILGAQIASIERDSIAADGASKTLAPWLQVEGETPFPLCGLGEWENGRLAMLRPTETNLPCSLGGAGGVGGAINGQVSCYAANLASLAADARHSAGTRVVMELNGGEKRGFEANLPLAACADFLRSTFYSLLSTFSPRSGAGRPSVQAVTGSGDLCRNENVGPVAGSGDHCHNSLTRTYGCGCPYAERFDIERYDMKRFDVRNYDPKRFDSRPIEQNPFESSGFELRDVELRDPENDNFESGDSESKYRAIEESPQMEISPSENPLAKSWLERGWETCSEVSTNYRLAFARYARARFAAGTVFLTRIQGATAKMAERIGDWTPSKNRIAGRINLDIPL